MFGVNNTCRSREKKDNNANERIEKRIAKTM